MQRKVLELLETLGIEDIVYIDEDVYCDKEQIVYSTKENDSNFTDDKSKSVEYEISIIYKYRDITNVMKYTEIKNTLKNNGYIFKKASDSKEGDIYKKDMLFIIEVNQNG